MAHHICRTPHNTGPGQHNSPKHLPIGASHLRRRHLPNLYSLGTRGRSVSVISGPSDPGSGFKMHSSKINRGLKKVVVFTF
ncbi:hypothetical protein M378DRAFT_169730 [Amanita muscaria Koide BX008]|uniref:Uncharacterized protein n=1 Tax=Amanita muscaria (strain Koide BX008) TaxID=946122 RepID=A0A0C2WQU4_AMAMK|nr:hypothetical protein M378DRAFT_169730 [Amanita muscaria Koide BX008]